MKAILSLVLAMTIFCACGGPSVIMEAVQVVRSLDRIAELAVQK